jgi:hypothetical protein
MIRVLLAAISLALMSTLSGCHSEADEHYRDRGGYEEDRDWQWQQWHPEYEPEQRDWERPREQPRERREEHEEHEEHE